MGKNRFSNNSIAWISFGIITAFLFGYFLGHPPINWGGDIIEYYGITESLINHLSTNLTVQDKNNIEKVLNPAYFNDPQYYIQNKEGLRYPVHFIFYSILLVPVRLILQSLQQNPTKTLVITNLIILSLTVFYILKRFINNPFKKILFLIVVYLSPFVYFLAWPGPEILYMSSLLLAVFFFYEEKYFRSAILTVIASWHSQPLAILALVVILFYLIKSRIQLKSTIIPALSLLGMLFLPYFYNYIIFGTWTPWGLLKNIWTQYYGFGIQNINLKKFLEQLFDLNIGLFWYIPTIFVLGFYSFIKTAIKDRLSLLLLIVLIATAFFYQTNPAWNYGTSGYGPTRHILFLLPFLIYFFIKWLQQRLTDIIILLFFVSTQIFVLSFNGYLVPNFLNALDHSPFAKFILNNFPTLYNPTPEIFVDRTNHTDFDYITTAIYKNNGVCKKAYVLTMEKDKLIKECKFIPEKYKNSFTNPYKTKTVYSRKLKTTQATLYADSDSCKEGYKPTTQRPYICLKTVEDVIKHTGIKDISRIQKLSQYEGAWIFSWGLPLTITIPPGYVADYYSFSGVYVNY